MAQLPDTSTALAVRSLRQRSGLSMAQIARALGYRGASSYQRYEDPNLFNKEYLPLEIAKKLAQAIVGKGSPPIAEAEVMALAGIEIDDHTAGRMIPVVGYVGAGSEVYPIDDHAKGAGLEEVECPWDALGPSTVAVRVRGDSMMPAYFDGDLIFYERNHADFTHLLGKECVVALADGRCFVKTLRRTQGGQWYLHSHNAEPILGVQIKWAAKVRLIKRAD